MEINLLIIGLVILFVILIIGVIVYFSTRSRSSSPSSLSPTRSLSHPTLNSLNKTLFVSIASYRDSECPLTLRDLYNKADSPSRIFVGICQQNADEDIDCVRSQVPSFVPSDNIRISRFKSIEAQGPCVARYYCSLLFNNEDYFFQIDSHTRFSSGWDTQLINDLMVYQNRFKNNKIILTSYPLEYQKDTNINLKSESTTVFSEIKFNNDNLLQPLSAIISSKDPLKWSFDQPCIAGGMLFGPGSLVRDVPFDRDLSYLFHGEELLYAIRLWSAGYRLLAPPTNVVYHFYTRSDEPKVWNERPTFWAENQQIVGRVKRSLLLDSSVGPGVTLAPPIHKIKEFYKYYDIDIIKKLNKKYNI